MAVTARAECPKLRRSMAMSAADSKYWDDSMLAAHLNVRPSWVAAQGRAGKIPCIQFGKYRRYDHESDDFKAWLDSLRMYRYTRAESEKDEPNRKGKNMARQSYQKGSVEPRKRKHGLVYVLRYRLRQGGKWIEKTEELKGARTEKAACIAANKRMREINRLNNSDSMTVSDFINELWQKHLSKKKPSTISSYNSLIERFVIPTFGDRLVNTITPAELTLFFSSLEKQGHKGQYLLNLYSLMSAIFSLAVEYELIETNPIRPKLHRPEVSRKEKPVLTCEQIQVFLSKVPERYWLMLVLDAIIILRRGELTALRWLNLNCETRSLSITHNLWRGHLVRPKTSESEKVFMLPDDIFELLLKHREKSKFNRPEDFIFCNEDGSAIQPDHVIRSVIHPALKASGIEPQPYAYGFHLLRHSGATLLYGLTKDVKLVQSQARHSRLSTTTDIYIHGSEEIPREPSELLAKAILKNHGGLSVARAQDKLTEAQPVSEKIQ